MKLTITIEASGEKSTLERDLPLTEENIEAITQEVADVLTDLSAQEEAPPPAEGGAT